MAYVVNAVWRAKPGSESIVAEALEQLIEPSRAEPGNVYYQPYTSADEPGTFRIFEVYADEAAFKAHGESEHFARWGHGQAIPELAERGREFFETWPS
ncbi:putative quinol monooxygenase [Ornithinimicrobium cavernae]|uniref:putative quinol monooxygenase n=1 Tax=Ornithinimicrobium cavernae TaxID=2666047 RepID=UPI000D69231F|nr:putative quinol monooxygenase [Ornithinimicrobium cavernae]